MATIDQTLSRPRKKINYTYPCSDAGVVGEEAKKKRRYALALREAIAQENNKKLANASDAQLEVCYTPYEWKIRTGKIKRREPRKSNSSTVQCSKVYKN